MSRIALLIHSLDEIGGAERQLLHLAHGLAQRHHSVTVIVLFGTGGDVATDLRTSGIELLALQMRGRWIDPRGWLRYLRWHRSNRPQIVHAHLASATFFARFVRLIAPVPVVVDTFHSSAPGQFRRRLLYRLTSGLTQRLTAVSHAVAQSLLAHRMTPPAKLSILPNGIPLPRLAPAPVTLTGTFQWLAVGRLVPLKDYPTLLHAFATLPEHPRLTIAGAGTEESALRELAASLNIAHRVHFAGFVADTATLFATANAFVLSSRWEGLPLGPLEAAAHSLPVVATDGPGTRDTILLDASAASGILVPIADPPALASAMASLMHLSPADRQAMGARGRAFVEANYSLDGILDQWEDLYRQLLAAHPNPTRRA